MDNYNCPKIIFLEILFLEKKRKMGCDENALISFFLLIFLFAYFFYFLFRLYLGVFFLLINKSTDDNNKYPKKPNNISVYKMQL